MKDRVSRLVASVFYIGFIPGAPGTYGSLAAAAGFSGIYLATYRILPALHLSTICLISMAGALAAARLSHSTGVEDPQYVIIDEVAGQLTTFLFLPVTAFNIIVGIVAFRLFDIWKPYPIRKIESYGRGVGIMADDLLAGVYGNIILQGLNLIFFTAR